MSRAKNECEATDLTSDLNESVHYFFGTLEKLIRRKEPSYLVNDYSLAGAVEDLKKLGLRLRVTIEPKKP